MDNITLLVKEGYRESEVMEMPLDKMDLCTKSIRKRISDYRATMVMDTAGAISGILGEKDTLTKYLDTLKGEDHG